MMKSILSKIFVTLFLSVLSISGSLAATDTLETIEFQDITITNIDQLQIHASPMPPSGDWWIKINGELIKNKRKTIYLWKGEPRRRSAISGRIDGEGVWRWRQRPKSQGYAPFDLDVNDVIHIICRNGDEINRCYKIIEVRTDSAGTVRYFKGRQVPCS